MMLHVDGLVPDPQEAVPGSRGDGHAILRHSQAAHSIVVAREDTCRKQTSQCQ
jgi:hypothetical protein